MQTTRYKFFTTYIMTSIVALLLVACSGENPIEPPDPCETGEGGATSSASSTSSSGSGGASGGEPTAMLVHRDELEAVSSWCIGPYLWPNTVEDVLTAGIAPSGYCACNLDGNSCSPKIGAPEGAYCGMLMKPSPEGSVPFFFAHGIWSENGRPYICLLNEFTPAR